MLTRFVKSQDEIRRFQDIYATPSFYDIRSLALTFETDPRVFAELIPAPLKPADSPRVSLSVSEIRRSDCVGGFFGCSFNLACSYEGREGLYCLTMPMSTDTAVVFGRELFAEPKKLADIELEEHDRCATGRVTRHGITYIEIAGSFDEDLQPIDRDSESHHYYFKYLPAADGQGLAHDPQLVRVTHRGRTHSLARGQGTVTFRESPHDPVIDIPVLSVGGATLSRGETHTTAEVVTTVPAEQFLQHAYGKIDDLLVWAEEPVLT